MADKKSAKLPAHRLLPSWLTGTVASLISMSGQLKKASKFAEDVVRFKLLLDLLTSMEIPEKHVEQVVGDLKHQRSIADSAGMIGVSAALTEVIDKLNQATDESD